MSTNIVKTFYLEFPIKKYKHFPRQFKGQNIYSLYNALHQDMLKLSSNDLEELQNEINEIERHNRDIYIENKNIIQKNIKTLEDIFKSIGMLTYKTSKNGKYIGEYKEFKAAIKSMKETVGGSAPSKPSFHVMWVDGKKYQSYCSSITIPKFVEQVKERLKEEQEIEEKKRKVFAKSCSLAEKHNISIEDFDLVKKVREAEEKEWLNKNYPKGKEIIISCCDCCDSYFMGEKRCSCGNRRIDVYVEGDVGNFNLITEAY